MNSTKNNITNVESYVKYIEQKKDNDEKDRYLQTVAKTFDFGYILRGYKGKMAMVSCFFYDIS